MKLPAILSTMIATFAISGVHAEDAGKAMPAADMPKEGAAMNDGAMKMDKKEENMKEGMEAEKKMAAKGKKMDKKEAGEAGMKNHKNHKHHSHEMKEGSMEGHVSEPYDGPYDYDKMENREGGDKVAGKMETPGQKE